MLFCENIFGCVCARCGEPLTAPQFYNGNPYGWSCIQIVDPSAKKSKVRWTISESSNFNPDTDTEVIAQKIAARLDGKKYVGYVYKPEVGLTWTGTWCKIDSNNNVYVNLKCFKKK